MQLQALVNDALGEGYAIKLRRQDFYYWDMQLNTAREMDEALSEEICTRLNLQNVDKLMFLDDHWVESSSLNELLSKLTHREVTSSHADDYGVWIICRGLIWSSPEFVGQLLVQCEQRLRKEIGSRNYPAVNPNTACHQLFGFKEALIMLGLLTQDDYMVTLEHFADANATESEVRNCNESNGADGSQ